MMSRSVLFLSLLITPGLFARHAPEEPPKNGAKLESISRESIAASIKEIVPEAIKTMTKVYGRPVDVRTDGVIKEIARRLGARFGEVPGRVAMQMYDISAVGEPTVEKAKKLREETLEAALERIKKLHSIESGGQQDDTYATFFVLANRVLWLDAFLKEEKGTEEHVKKFREEEEKFFKAASEKNPEGSIAKSPFRKERLQNWAWIEKNPGSFVDVFWGAVDGIGAKEFFERNKGGF